MKTKFPTNELSRCYHLILTLDKLTNTIEKEFYSIPISPIHSQKNMQILISPISE